ncbi:unnamed protein product [Sphagnum tenellum]
MEGKHLLQQRKLNAGFLQMKHFTAAMTVFLLCIVCSVGIQHGDISPEHVMWFVVAIGDLVLEEQSLGLKGNPAAARKVSAVLKTFADYVDSLCTTPYPDDYDIWLQPLNRALPHGGPRRMNDLSFRGSDFAMESSGTPSVI